MPPTRPFSCSLGTFVFASTGGYPPLRGPSLHPGPPPAAAHTHRRSVRPTGKCSDRACHAYTSSFLACTHAVSYFVLNVLLVGQWHKVGSGIVPWTFGLKGAMGIRANVIGNDCFCPACCWAFVFCRVPSRKALLPGTIQRNVVYVLFNKKRMRRLVLLFAPSHRQVGWLMGVSCFVL